MDYTFAEFFEWPEGLYRPVSFEGIFSLSKSWWSVLKGHAYAMLIGFMMLSVRYSCPRRGCLEPAKELYSSSFQELSP